MMRRMGRWNFVMATMFLAALFGLTDGYAAKKQSGYTTAPVSGGATLTGTITLKGKPKAPKTFELAKFPQPEFCSKAASEGGKRFLHEVKAGKGNALKDVVVVIEGIDAGKPFDLKTHIDTKFCQFLVAGGPSSFVGVVSRAMDFTVTNHDEAPNEKGEVVGVLHNPHGFAITPKKSPSTMFNQGMPQKGQTLSFKRDMMKLRRAPFMLLKCDQHEFMQAWFKVVNDPYYAIVDDNGSFSIDQIPPGQYKVVAWHPILGEQTQDVTFSANGKQKVEFQF